MYTFAADAEQLTELATELRDTLAENVTTEISDTYSEIENFGDAWSGESYDQFVEGCGNYQDALNTIPAVLTSFASTFDKASSAVEPLISTVESQIATIS